MAEAPITIAGGGIAGLAAALGLARIGRPCMVLERSLNFETAGAGLQLGPNAVRALQRLGAWEAMEPNAFAPEDIVIRDGLTGRTLQRIPLGAAFERRFGQPYRVAHRSDLLDALLVTAKSIGTIELRNGVRAGPGLPTGAGLVIGADGIRSELRTSIVGKTTACFGGQAIYRAVVAAHDHPLSVILWLCPGAHVVHYPVSGGRLLNLVAVADSGWTSEDWSGLAGRDEVAAAFSRCCLELRDTLSGPTDWRKWAAAELGPLATWSRGRTVLIGDAAHACLPYLAQGAAMALEDAVVLAMSLQTSGSAETAFKAYEAARRPRVERVRRASARLAGVYHAKGIFRLARNTALALAGSDRFLNRLAWLYGYDPPALILR